MMGLLAVLALRRRRWRAESARLSLLLLVLFGCRDGAQRASEREDGGTRCDASADASCRASRANPASGRSSNDDESEAPDSGRSGREIDSGAESDSGTGGTRPPPKVVSADSGTKEPEPDAAVVSDPCRDGEKGAHETGVDCGGPECAPCADGRGCLSASDCESGYCSAGRTCTVERCDDEAKNQDETDVDCGGATCEAKCALGKNCAVPEDCQTASCNQGVCACVPSATCGAGECGSEPDGCGGMLTCDVCPAGHACNRDRKCVCDPDQCNNDCPILESRCCKTDGSCGCASLLSNCT